MTTTDPTTTAGTRQLGHRTMEQELRVDDLPIRGEFPRWLSGTFMRATPATFDFGTRSVGHWFDGLGMLNVFSFSDGRVSYANRLTQTERRRKAQQGHFNASFSVGTDPCRRLGKRVMSLFDPDTHFEPNINIARFGDRYFLATETPCPLEFDPDTLQTKGFVDLGHDRRDVHVLYDHLQFDPGAEELTTVTTRAGLRNEHRIDVIDRQLRRRRVGGTRAGQPPEYMHSFAMTEHYVVLPLQPLTYSLTGLMRTGMLRDSFSWKPENGATFAVIDRRTGELHSRHRAKSFFYWHTINAYEHEREIVVDIVTSDTPQSVWDLELPKLRDPDHRPRFYGAPRRYRLPLDGGPATEEQLADLRMEFPRINDRHNTLPYRFTYGIAYHDGDSDWFDEIVKVDVDTGGTRTWREPGCYPSEPIFVPAPGATAEDEGAVLNVVLDSRSGTSFMLVLDAATLTELARAELPHHLPFNFHAQFYGDPHT